MMTNTPDPLAQLRDIHLPHPISFWPLAPGWYYLAGFIFIMTLIIAIFFYRRWKRLEWQRIALTELNQLKKSWQNNVSNNFVTSELSILLRRATLACFPREKIAGLSGEEWLTFLDQSIKTKSFTEGCGRLLITAPYQSKIPNELNDLFQLIETWLKKVIKYA